MLCHYTSLCTDSCSYVLSTILAKVTGLSSLTSLRAINALLLPCAILLILDLDVQLGRGKLRRDPTRRQSSRPATTDLSTFSVHQLHVAFNVCLFPPLFFFSALYYTDVASVVSVLLFWDYFLRVQEKTSSTVLQEVKMVLLGLFSLTFRQTNIFWVSVFPAAIVLVSSIDIGLEDHRDDGTLSDPPVRESYADGKSILNVARSALMVSTDYCFFVVSLVRRLVEATYVTMTGHWAYLKVICLLLPYAVILAAFGGFVLWNGGVVLGRLAPHLLIKHN